VSAKPVVTESARVRRRYDSTLRPQRAAETRDRIVDAGCALLRASSIRDWRGLTIRAVAERAGVHERTVFRHFTNERGLRDAVMHRLEEQSGIHLDGLTLDDVVDVTVRIFESVSAHPIEPSGTHDPTLNEAGRRQRGALLGAVADHTEDWPVSDQTVAAAMLDVLWGVATYERVVVDWRLDHDEALRGITWVMRLVEAAIREGRSPGEPSARRAAIKPGPSDVAGDGRRPRFGAGAADDPASASLPGRRRVPRAVEAHDRAAVPLRAIARSSVPR
jgi:AcrR family transcriptional regulator